MLSFLILILKLQAFVYATIALEHLPSTNPPPTKRLYHFMDYNSATEQLIIFGGYTSAELLYNDVWAFDLNRFEYYQLEPTNEISPDPRFGSGGFVDVASNSLYIFGGKTTRGPINDMWKFSLDEFKWEEVDISENSPPPVYFYGNFKAYDNDTLKFYIFGGEGLRSKTNEAWVYYFDNNTWENLIDTQGDNDQKPPKSSYPSIVVFDNYLYVAAGDITNQGQVYSYSDTFRQNLNTRHWEKLPIPNSEAYFGRYLAGSFLKDDHFYLVLGWSNVIREDLDSILTLDLNNPVKWTELSTKNCLPRDSFSYSLVSDTFFMFGGFAHQVIINSLLSFNLTSSTCKLIHGSNDYPSPRMYHSMVAINTDLYIYGGQGYEVRFNDLWKFDTITQQWSLLQVSGTSPGYRSSHAYGSQGDLFIVWGGYTDEGYSNDMYLFEVNTNTWTHVEYTGDAPSSRRGACLVVNLPQLYIFGGENSISLLNDLWIYDSGKNTYTQIPFKTGIYPAPVKYPSCELIGDKLFVSYGATYGEVPVCTVHSFNIIEQDWKLELNLDTSSDCLTLAAVKIINSKYSIVVGGEVWGTDAYLQARIIDISDGSVGIFEISDYFYSGASALIGTKFYMSGGATLFKDTLSLSVPSNNFYMLDLSKFNESELEVCSPGTYFRNGNCNFCIQGTYNSEVNMTSCTKCDAGKYNSNDGASSNNQCYPCPSGYYSSRPGSVMCNSCPIGYTCPVGSKTYYEKNFVSSSSMSQPARYKPNMSKLDESKNILYGSTFGLLLIISIITLFNKKIKSSLFKIDLYKTNHNVIIDHNTMLIKNNFGGFFSLIFVAIAIVLIITAILEYQYDNITENKALVPLVILGNIVDKFVGNLTANITFYDYGGDCSEGSGENLVLTFENLDYDIYTNKMQKNNQDCSVLLELKDCEIMTGAYIIVKIQSYSSFCSSIGIKINTTSSIENEFSVVSDLVSSGNDLVFRGFLPSQFNIEVFSSLYQPEDSSKDYTGYHVSINSLAQTGSTYTIYELAFSSDLSVQINLVRNSNGLYTKRFYNRTFLILIGSLIGSVFGVMGAIGGVMKVVEGNIHKIGTFINSKNKIEKIRKKNNQLKEETGVDSFDVLGRRSRLG